MRQIPHLPVSLLLITSDVRIFISPILRISGNFPRTLFFTAPLTTFHRTLCIVYTINCALSSEKFPPREKNFTTKQPKEAPILSGAPRHQENISGFIYNSLCLCVLVVNRSVKEKRKRKREIVLSPDNPIVQISRFPVIQMTRCPNFQLSRRPDVHSSPIPHPYSLFRDFNFDEEDFAIAHHQYA